MLLPQIKTRHYANRRTLNKWNLLGICCGEGWGLREWSEGRRQMTFVSCPEQMPREWSPTNVSLKWPYCAHWGSILVFFLGLYNAELQETHREWNFWFALVPSHLVPVLNDTALQAWRQVDLYAGRVGLCSFSGTTRCKNIGARPLSERSLSPLSFPCHLQPPTP